MDTSHYITLTSRVTDKNNSDKRLEKFVTNLPSDCFDLQDEWELGLTEISFPKIWFNIPVDQIIELIRYKNKSKNYMQNIDTDVLIVKAGYYTINQIVDKCNELIETIFETYGGLAYIKGFSEKWVGSKPRLEIQNDYIKYWHGMFENNELFFVKYGDFISNILGLDQNAIMNIAYFTFKEYDAILLKQLELDKIEGYPSQIAWKSYDVNRNLKYLYISSGNIKNSFYNNRVTNLLRIVNIPENSKYGDQISQIYDNVYYFPIDRNRFNFIDIEILMSDSENKEYVPFLFGEIYLTLHLRKINKIVQIKLEPETEECKPELPVSPFDNVKGIQ